MVLKELPERQDPDQDLPNTPDTKGGKTMTGGNAAIAFAPTGFGVEVPLIPDPVFSVYRDMGIRGLLEPPEMLELPEVVDEGRSERSVPAAVEAPEHDAGRMITPAHA